MPKEPLLDENEKSLICRKCDTEFEGNYCPECGQAAKNLNRPFHFVIYDFAGTVFSFDTRFFRSLKYLITSPGKIAHDFVEGKRARYMAPFQMYVFVSFVFFFTISLFTKSSLKTNYDDQSRIELLREDSLAIDTDSLGNFSVNTLADFDSEKIHQLKLHIDNELRTDTTMDKNEVKVYFRLSRLLSDPNMFFVAIFKYVSWGMFLLMPLFALLLMLFFGRKGYYYTAHLTMSLNLHTFLFIVLLFGLLLRMIFHSLPGIVILILFLVFSTYEYIGIKRMYEKKPGKTFFFAGLMNFIYFFTILFASTGIIAVAFLNF
jgi:hypothetical protein